MYFTLEENWLNSVLTRVKCDHFML